MLQKGLKGVVAVQTKIASVDGDQGELRYRGLSVDQAVSGRTFEETAFFLWNGAWPEKNELQSFEEQLKKQRILPDHINAIAKLLPTDSSIMDNMRTLMSAFNSKEFSQQTPKNQALSLTAALPVIVAKLYRLKHGLEPIEARQDLGHTANYLWMLNGHEPSSVHVDALDTYLKLTMEHGMNASTFAARVTVSTESDLVAAITSALGTMKGPLHGGAPSGVIDLLEEIRTPGRIESVIQAKLDCGEKIMGFGHRIYRTEDPRSIILREKCLELQGNDNWLDLAVEAEKQITTLLNDKKPGRALHTNVEFYAAAIMRSIEMPPELFTPTFSIARIVGWSAHVLEQQQDNTIFRPQSEYIGN